MSEKNDLLIENGQSSWNISLDGNIEGTYRGTFKFRCVLTPTQQIAAGKEYRELLGANPTLASEHDSFLAYALTQLKYRVISSPPFWSSTSQKNGYAGDLLDEEIISAVLDAAIRSEEKYKSDVKKRKEDSINKAREAAEKILNEQKKDESES